jgi:hypothetical protein
MSLNIASIQISNGQLAHEHSVPLESVLDARRALCMHVRSSSKKARRADALFYCVRKVQSARGWKLDEIERKKGLAQFKHAH